MNATTTTDNQGNRLTVSHLVDVSSSLILFLADGRIAMIDNDGSVVVRPTPCAQCAEPTPERFCNACVGAEMAKIQSEESN